MAAPVNDKNSTAAAKVVDQKKKEQCAAVLELISAPNLVTRESTLAAVAEMPAAKSMAGVIMDVMEKASSPTTSMSQIAATIKQDPVLSARVMQLASSGAYAGPKPRTATLDDAVRAIGASAIRDLAASLGVFSSFPAGDAAGPDLLRCWQHAIGVATLMSRIVPRSEAVPAGIPHLIGLCHDLPEILLRQRFPQEFSAAGDFARQSKVPVSRLFLSVFGISLAELSEAMLAKLNLPPIIANPIREFSKSALSSPDAYQGQVLRALAIANYFSHAMLLTASTDEVVSPVMVNECRMVLLASTRLNWAEIRSETITTTSMLSKLKSEAQAEASEALIQRSERIVGYVRHGSFAELDPLEAALTNLCELTVLPTPPCAGDLEKLEGIVVAAPGTDTSLASQVIRLRAQCGVELPILHLSGLGSPKSFTSINGLEEVQYPVSMNRLAGFIATLKPQSR